MQRNVKPFQSSIVDCSPVGECPLWKEKAAARGGAAALLGRNNGCARLNEPFHSTPAVANYLRLSPTPLSANFRHPLWRNFATGYPPPPLRSISQRVGRVGVGCRQPARRAGQPGCITTFARICWCRSGIVAQSYNWILMVKWRKPVRVTLCGACSTFDEWARAREANLVCLWLSETLKGSNRMLYKHLCECNLSLLSFQVKFETFLKFSALLNLKFAVNVELLNAKTLHIYQGWTNYNHMNLKYRVFDLPPWSWNMGKK